MALSSLAVTPQIGLNWQAATNLTGGDYTNPISNSNRILKQQAYGTTVANGALGGADEFVSYLISLTAGASTTVDLSALTNILNTASITVARIKAILVRLLSPTDDATNGTLCSGIIVGPAGGAYTNCAQLDFGAGAGLTVNVSTVSTGAITAVAVVAGGTGYPPSSTFLVAVLQSTATGGLLAATTNSSGVVTAVAIVNGGTGYSVATPLSTFVISFNAIYKGGAKLYFDQVAGGFTVGSTTKNIRISNQDQAVAAKVQLTLIPAST